MAHEEQSAIAEMTDEQFRQHALEILQQNLGSGGFARFLRVYRSGISDFTRDRHQWIDQLTFDQILEQSRKIQIPAAE